MSVPSENWLNALAIVACVGTRCSGNDDPDLRSVPADRADQYQRNSISRIKVRTALEYDGSTDLQLQNLIYIETSQD